MPAVKLLLMGIAPQYYGILFTDIFGSFREKEVISAAVVMQIPRVKGSTNITMNWFENAFTDLAK